MDVPLEIAYRGVRKTEAIEKTIRDRVARLERAYGHLISCRVAVEKPQRHQQTGNPYRVRIDMNVPPGHELVIRREATEGDMHDPLHVRIRQAFKAAFRELRKLHEQQQGQVKYHPHQQVTGIVQRLFADEGYGFIRPIDVDEEIYFHRNSVLHNQFERMQVGTGVRFVKEQGEKGPQASTVEIMSKLGPGVQAQ